MNLDDLKNLIYDQHLLASAKDRREILISKMLELDGQNKNCSKCTGMCCTYLYNSMKTTPLEAVELYLFLAKENRLNNELIEQLKECIKDFRLDKDINLGKGKSFRRTYTCPFFKKGAKGCSISLHDKPYGCLGFNPAEVEVSSEGKCKVYIGPHEEREARYIKVENKINQILINELGLYWEKLPMPLAIIELINKLGK